MRKNALAKSENQSKMGLLWRAPELLRLREEDFPKYGTKKGDIYSFGVIMHEILFRSMPFSLEDHSAEGWSEAKLPTLRM